MSENGESRTFQDSFPDYDRFVVSRIPDKTGGNQVVANSNPSLFSEPPVKIDPGCLYYLSGWIRGCGSETSLVHVGFDHMWRRGLFARTRKGELVSMDNGNYQRRGKSSIIMKYDKEKRIIEIIPADWKNLRDYHNKGTKNHKRYAGVYLDGNVNQAPDFVVSCGNVHKFDGGGFTEVFPEKGIIKVSEKFVEVVGDKIQPGISAFANHLSASSGGTYNYVNGEDYPSPRHFDKKSGWMFVEGICTGRSFATDQYPCPYKIRPGATDIRIVILPNYQCTQRCKKPREAICEIRDMKLEKLVPKNFSLTKSEEEKDEKRKKKKEEEEEEEEKDEKTKKKEEKNKKSLDSMLEEYRSRGRQEEEERLSTLMKNMKLDDFHILCRLGGRRDSDGFDGCNALVYNGVYKKSRRGEIFALKILFNYDANSPDNSVFYRMVKEEKMRSRLLHPNLAQLVHCFFENDVNYESLPDSENLDLNLLSRDTAVLVWKWYQGSLKEVISEIRRTGRRIEPMKFLMFAHDLLSGIQFLRHHRIAHRDIKPDNVFVTEDGRLVIGDFGCAVQCTAEREGMRVRREKGMSIGGAPHCLAPEVHSTREGQMLDYGKNDLFAVGLILHEMLTDETYEAFSVTDIRLRSGDNYQEVPMTNYCENEHEIIKLVREMCRTDPTRRLDCHTALKNCRKIIQKLLFKLQPKQQGK